MIIPSKYMTSKAATTPAAPAATATPATEEKTESVAADKDFSSLGNVWEKGNFHRLYLDPVKVAKAIGMDVDYYKSGNVRSASINGESISNNDCYKVLTSWNGAYIDLTTGEMHERSGYSVRYEDEIMAAYKDIAD